MSSKIVRLTITSLCFVALIGMNANLFGQGGVSENDDDPSNGRGQARRTAAKPKFESLLAERNLDKFRGYKQEQIGDGWKLQGKYLYFDGSGGGDIITKETYNNFELQFEWKISKGGNSGVMYRVSLGDDAPYITGPEYQVLDDSEHADGKNPMTSAGSLYGLYAPGESKTLRSLTSYNKSKIIVDGDKVVHYLNNKKVLEAEIGSDDWNTKIGESKFKSWEKFAKNRGGHIAFQDHGNEVWYRNIRIKRLPDTDAPSGNVASNSGNVDRGPKGDDKPVVNGNPRLSRFGGAKKNMKDALVGAGGNKSSKKKEDKDDDDEDK